MRRRKVHAGSNPAGGSIFEKGILMIQTLFNVLSTLMLLFLGLIWKSGTTLNTTLKFILYILSVYGIVICLMNFGFVIKP